MPKIKWIGIINEDEIKKYQVGELSNKAVKMKMPKNMNEMMIKALPFAIPAIILMRYIAYYKNHVNQQNTVNSKYIFLGLLIGFLLLFVHELLHAIVYPKEVNAYIGIAKPFTFVSLASYPLNKIRFVLMCLLPYLLGIIPFIAFCITPANMLELNGILWGMAIVGLVSPYPDAYNVYQVIKQVPKGRKVQFFEDDTYYI